MVVAEAVVAAALPAVVADGAGVDLVAEEEDEVVEEELVAAAAAALAWDLCLPDCPSRAANSPIPPLPPPLPPREPPKRFMSCCWFMLLSNDWSSESPRLLRSSSPPPEKIN